MNSRKLPSSALQTDLTALRDELREYSEHGTLGDHSIRMVISNWADRLTDLLGSLRSENETEIPKRTTALELLSHVQRNHSLVNRDRYIECSCGTTFWFPGTPEPTAALGSLPVPAQVEAPKCEHVGNYRDNARAAYACPTCGALLPDEGGGWFYPELSALLSRSAQEPPKDQHEDKSEGVSSRVTPFEILFALLALIAEMGFEIVNRVELWLRK